MPITSFHHAFQILPPCNQVGNRSRKYCQDSKKGTSMALERTSSVEFILGGTGRAGRPLRPGQPHGRPRLWIEYPIHNAT
eukprot:scaffold187_cov329-Pavlova_lutheri.AAC.1